jgi:hypothetical protein
MPKQSTKNQFGDLINLAIVSRFLLPLSDGRTGYRDGGIAMLSYHPKLAARRRANELVTDSRGRSGTFPE